VLLQRGPDRVSPFSIPSIIPNMGAGWLSIELGHEGAADVGVHGLRRVEHGDRRRR
jgi:3-oxoacyl-(acyl-carrier-protein) synthase